MFLLKRSFDLNSLISSYSDLSSDSFKRLQAFFEFKLRNDEIEQIKQLISNISLDNTYLHDFFVGYTIPQINKEFDLLRIGDNFLINIEIKGSSTLENAKSQLLKNKYYLSSLNLPLKLFTYISENNSIYYLDEDNSLIDVNFSFFEEILLEQKVKQISNIDNLFDPSFFLVSPFNNYDKFIANSYFLTGQQQNFKKQFDDNNFQFTILNGLPGTGKTLLLYDIAKKYMDTQKGIIVHCGLLNDGHRKLKTNNKWNIISAKYIDRISSLSPDIIFIDEVQRLRPYQLDMIINYIKEHEIIGVFSIDPKQILSLKERNFNNFEKLSILPNTQVMKLSKKIRTNKELASFIKGFFNLNNMKYCNNTENVSIQYFSNIKQAKAFSIEKESLGWKIIDYTNQDHNGKHINEMRLDIGVNTHQVLGQEFDKVLVIVGPSFYYNDENSISVKNTNFYDPERMIYQSVTRARKKITILIVNNPVFMNKLTTALVPVI